MCTITVTHNNYEQMNYTSQFLQDQNLDSTTQGKSAAVGKMPLPRPLSYFLFRCAELGVDNPMSHELLASSVCFANLDQSREKETTR